MSGQAPIGSFRYFDNPRASIDSSVTYFTLAQCLALDAHAIVDVGCGRGAFADDSDRGRPTHDFRGPGRKVIGIDVDPHISGNPLVDEYRPMSLEARWPLSDGSADLVTADWVLEHVQNTSQFVGELRRVLRPGGAFVARTVSRYSLLAAGSRVVPNAWHSRVLGRLQPGRHSRDVFPTAYRMNDRKTLAGQFGADFEWTTLHRPGFGQYLLRWPTMSRLAEATEARAPRALNTVMVIAARKHE